MSYERFDSEARYLQATHEIIALAQRELCIFDRDLVRLQCGTPAMANALGEFIGADPLRRIRIALHDSLPLANSMPRLLAVMQRYEHAFFVRRVTKEFRHLTDCHVLADGQHGIRRFHADYARGALILDDETEILPWWRRFDELWQHCQPVSLTAVTGL